MGKGREMFLGFVIAVLFLLLGAVCFAYLLRGAQ
jgi:hypothetical protein